MKYSSKLREWLTFNREQILIPHNILVMSIGVMISDRHVVRYLFIELCMYVHAQTIVPHKPSLAYMFVLFVNIHFV